MKEKMFSLHFFICNQLGAQMQAEVCVRASVCACVFVCLAFNVQKYSADLFWLLSLSEELNMNRYVDIKIPPSVQMVSQISHTSPHHRYHVTRGARLAVPTATFQGVWPAVTGRAAPQPARLLRYPEYQIAASVISSATTESEAEPGPPASMAACESPACGLTRGLFSSSTSKATFHCQISIFQFVFDLSPLYLILCI